MTVPISVLLEGLALHDSGMGWADITRKLNVPRHTFQRHTSRWDAIKRCHEVLSCEESMAQIKAMYANETIKLTEIAEKFNIPIYFFSAYIIASFADDEARAARAIKQNNSINRERYRTKYSTPWSDPELATIRDMRTRGESFVDIATALNERFHGGDELRTPSQVHYRHHSGACSSKKPRKAPVMFFEDDETIPPARGGVYTKVPVRQVTSYGSSALTTSEA